MSTPEYIFHKDVFARRIKTIKEAVPKAGLVYSMKANSFLVPYIPDEIVGVEVCSPGELQICKQLRVDPAKIIYSGVMKENEDIRDAINYGAGILTAESLRHLSMISVEAVRAGKPVKVLLRFSAGSQFGMSETDIFGIFENMDYYPGVGIHGIHYFSGTAKHREKQTIKDLEKLTGFLDALKEKFGYEPYLLEYGPGLAASYFHDSEEECEAEDMAVLSAAAPHLRALADKYPLNMEFGRFMSAPAGSFYSTVKDIKDVEGVTYAILDGGIHQLKYYGQNMAMKRMPIVQNTTEGEEKTYTLCGSLCTTADVILRDGVMKQLNVGDVLEFKRTGAYSATEGALLFLSRTMPAISITGDDGEVKLIREPVESWKLNI